MPYSPATGLPIESQTVSQMADRVLALPEGTRLYLLAPIVRGRKGEYRKELAELQKKGFQRLKVDGKFYEIAEAPALDKKFKHDIEVVVDRIVVRPDIGNRLADSIRDGARAADDGIAIVEFADENGGKRRDLLGEIRLPGVRLHHRGDRAAAVLLQQPAWRLPRMRRARHRAVLRAGAGGARRKLEPRARRHRALGANSASSPYYLQTLEALARAYHILDDQALEDLPKKFREVILYGSGEEEIKFTYDDGMRRYDTKKPFEGVIPNMERRWRETDSAWVREELERYQSEQPCEVCKGYRLKPEALAVKIGGLHIGQVSEMSIRDADAWFAALPSKLTPKQNEIAARILKEIRARLKFLNNVGLDYLTLSRASGTLSGGESQRIRLASQIGSGLTGVLYVLDEPSIGLHQRDNARLLETLKAPARHGQHRARGRA